METKTERKIEKIVIHHTAGSYHNPFLVDLLHRLRGLDSIGYHFLIGNGFLTRNGYVYKERPLNKIGAHAKGHNKDSIGIALIGNFEKRKPSKRQLSTLIDLLTNCIVQNNLTPEDIYSHKELNSNTVCPGKYIDLNEIRKTIEEKLKKLD